MLLFSKLSNYATALGAVIIAGIPIQSPPVLTGHNEEFNNFLTAMLYVFFVLAVVMAAIYLKYKPIWDKERQEREDARSIAEQKSKDDRASKYADSIKLIGNQVKTLIK